MRRALPMLAAIALAGCQVEVEGARCREPGSTADCPDGQACGTSGTCSERAASCTPCVPGAIECRDGDRMRCDPSDAECGIWVVEEDCGAFVCNDQGKPAACECAAAGSDLYVDASAGGTSSHLPTGAPSPPECRFPAIPEALAVATSGTIVHVVGPAATYSGLPIRVTKGVSLIADDAPLSPGSRVLTNDVIDGPGVVLEEGSRFEGFTVRATPGGVRRLGVQVQCAATAKVTITGARVDAEEGASLDTGIKLSGVCDVDLRDVEVNGATGMGLVVAFDSPNPLARAIGGRIEGCQTGASLMKGALRLDATTIANNRAMGVSAGDGEADTQFTANDALFTGNEDTALAVYGNARLDLRNNRVCGNGAVTERGALRRKVGGIFVRGAPPPALDLVFSGNEIHHNAWDQVFVTGTNLTWTLDGGTSAGACSSTRNLFVGYDVNTGRGVVADAPVNARWNAWDGVSPTPPPLGQDYEQLGAPVLETGASTYAFCDPLPALRPCP